MTEIIDADWIMAFVLFPAPNPPAHNILRLEGLPLVDAKASRTGNTFLIGPSPFAEAMMIKSPSAALLNRELDVQLYRFLMVAYLTAPPLTGASTKSIVGEYCLMRSPSLRTSEGAQVEQRMMTASFFKVVMACSSKRQLSHCERSTGMKTMQSAS